jgi:hypothetical protein
MSTFAPILRKIIIIITIENTTYIPIALFHIILYDESVNVSRLTI